MLGAAIGAMPFSNISPKELEGGFVPKEVERLLTVLPTIRQRAEV
jgi:hypothetical protein